MNKWLSKLKGSFPLFKKKTKSTSIDLLDITEDTQNAWWGNFTVGDEQSRYAKINGVVLCIDYYEKEWQIAHYREGQEKANSKSIATRGLHGDIRLTPLLPDRSLLFSLTHPILIPAKNAISLYLTTPVSIRIDIGNPPILLEIIQTETLPDTWFGKNTLYGELCYALSSSTTHLNELIFNNTHAITPLLIQNDSFETLQINEVKIPGSFLSIFTDHHNHLWTENLIMTFTHRDISNTDIKKGPPNGLKEPLLISSPRMQAKSNFIQLFNPI